MHVNRHMAQFARCAAHSIKNLTFGDDAATNTGTDGQIDQIVRALACSEQVFAERGGVGIVLDSNRDMKLGTQDVTQRRILPARQIGWREDHASTTIQWPRCAHADACNLFNTYACLVERLPN